jgi:hypothetical protein
LGLKARRRDYDSLRDFATWSADEIIGYDDLGVPR